MVMKGMCANGRRPFFYGKWSRILWHKKEGLKGKVVGRGRMVRHGFSLQKKQCSGVCRCVLDRGFCRFFSFPVYAFML